MLSLMIIMLGHLNISHILRNALMKKWRFSTVSVLQSTWDKEVTLTDFTMNLGNLHGQQRKTDLNCLIGQRAIRGDLMRKQKYLHQCLEIVHQHPRISTSVLCKYLGITRSKFYTFIKNVKPLDLFYIIKIGRCNYYTLTPSGRKYLQEIGITIEERWIWI